MSYVSHPIRDKKCDPRFRSKMEKEKRQTKKEEYKKAEKFSRILIRSCLRILFQPSLLAFCSRGLAHAVVKYTG